MSKENAVTNSENSQILQPQPERALMGGQNKLSLFITPTSTPTPPPRVPAPSPSEHIEPYALQTLIRFG